MPTSPDRKGDKIPIPGDYQVRAYYSGHRVQRFWHYTKLKEAENQLAVKDGDKLLDAGCGSGLLAYFMAANSKVEVWAVDANPAAIEFCQSNYKDRANLHFQLALIDNLPFSKNSFDKIVFLEVLEHLSAAQGETVLKTFFDLLKPGGKLVISTPNKKSLWPLTEFMLDKLRLVPNLKEGQHELLYTHSMLKRLGEEAGFTVSSRKTINFMSPWFAFISRRLALKIHALEMKWRCSVGSLLLYTFEKPL